MKIAFLSTFYPYRGGIAQFNASLFRALEKKHDVRAFNFSLQFPSLIFPGATQFVSEQDQADPIPSERCLNSINPLSYWATYRQIRKMQSDLLLLSYWLPLLAPAFGSVAWLLRREGVRVVSVLNNLIPHEHRAGDALFNRFYLSQNDAYIVMGEAVRRDLLRLSPGALHELHPHPVYQHFTARPSKAEARAYLGIPTDRKVLLFFGLIRHYKGLDLLIRAFNRLPEGYSLLIAGESYEDFAEYQSLIDSGGKKAAVYLFNRYIPDSEVPYFFQAADVCVLPYRSATQSGVVAIACDFGLPVIVTDVAICANRSRHLVQEK